MEQEAKTYTISDLNHSVREFSEVLLMLRTFYKDDVLVSDCELLYGLLSTSVNKGLNDAIVQAVVMFVDANKRLLSRVTDPTTVAKGVRGNIKISVAGTRFA